MTLSTYIKGGAAGLMAFVATLPAFAQDGPVKAPIAAGQHIADLIVETPSTPPQVMPLVAETAVGEAGFFRRAWAGLWSFFGA